MRKNTVFRGFTGLLCAGIALSSVSAAAEVDSGRAAGIANLFGNTSIEEESEVIIGPLAAASLITEAALSLNNGEEETVSPETEPVTEEGEHPAVLAAEARIKKEEESIYNELAFTKVTSFVNIRTEPDENAEPVGKIYDKSAARILETVETDTGTWYKINSGSVTGYIKAEFFVTGEEAKAMALEVGCVSATVNTDSLRLRESPDLGSATITVLSKDETYTVEESGAEFSKVSVDGELVGYVQNDYIDITVDYTEAISLEEEQAKLEEQARRRREAEEAEERQRREEEEEAARQAAREREDEDDEDDEEVVRQNEPEETPAAEQPKEEKPKTEKPKETEPSTVKKTGTIDREALAEFAASFEGNLDYVWGGTSLVDGADCSGFVQQVFKHFGKKLPRTSDEQGYCGKSVSSSDMRPGDLVYYGGHIAIYIGGGKVVHASNAKDGTKISNWNYRSVISIRNVIGD